MVLADDELLAPALDAAALRVSRVLPVGAVERVLGQGLLIDTTIENIARAKHEEYVRLECDQGRTSKDNSSLVSWDELPEPLKESNRCFADSVSRKLRDLGGA